MPIMKIKIFLFIILFVLAGHTRAQIPVTDAANISQSIFNSSQEIVQSTTTASNMIKNFQETVKIYKQGKEYYDALKSVSNLVKDARKVQKTILLVGEITDIYINSYQKILSDKNFSVDELTAIGCGYAQLLKESTDILLELKSVINVNGLSMNDRERLDIIDRVYNSVLEYRNLTNYYAQKNISVAYLRAAKKNEMDRFLSMYGTSDDRYW